MLKKVVGEIRLPLGSEVDEPRLAWPGWPWPEHRSGRGNQLDVSPSYSRNLIPTPAPGAAF